MYRSKIKRGNDTVFAMVMNSSECLPENAEYIYYVWYDSISHYRNIWLYHSSTLHFVLLI